MSRPMGVSHKNEDLHAKCLESGNTPCCKRDARSKKSRGETANGSKHNGRRKMSAEIRKKRSAVLIIRAQVIMKPHDEKPREKRNFPLVLLSFGQENILRNKKPCITESSCRSRGGYYNEASRYGDRRFLQSNRYKIKVPNGLRIGVSMSLRCIR